MLSLRINNFSTSLLCFCEVENVVCRSHCPLQKSCTLVHLSVMIQIMILSRRRNKSVNMRVMLDTTFILAKSSGHTSLFYDAAVCCCINQWKLVPGDILVFSCWTVTRFLSHNDLSCIKRPCFSFSKCNTCFQVTVSSGLQSGL